MFVNNLLSISSDLLKLIRSLGNKMTAADIRNAVLIIERMVPYINASREAQDIVMDCFDALMAVRKDVLRESEVMYDATTRLVL